MSRALLLLVVISLTTHSALAQVASCPTDDYNTFDGVSAPADLAEIVGSAAGDWLETSRRIDRLRMRAVEEDAETPFAALRKLAAVLKQIPEAYDGTPSKANQARLASLRPTTCPEDQAGNFVCAWEVLDSQVQVPEGEKDDWTCTNKARFVSYVLAAQKLVSRAVESHVVAAAKSLSRFSGQWERYVGSGYSQYPHEVWLNGWAFLDKNAWGPPRHQLIALHPAVGFGTANMTETGNAQRSAAFVLAVEGVGFVEYLQEFHHHIGVSVAAVLPNFEVDGLGIGPIVHFDGFGIGYNFGLRGDRPDTLFVLLDVTRSIDDYELLKNAGSWIRDKLN